MKVVLVSESLDELDELVNLTEESGNEIISYRSPMKALDNLEEILPDIVIINAIDFPRHWKIIVQHAHNLRNAIDHDIVVFLLINSDFELIELEKAKLLKIKACMNIQESVNNRYNSLKAVLKKNHRDLSTQTTNISFMFVNPHTSKIVTGRLQEVSESRVVFLPDSLLSVSNLQAGEVINSSVLKVGSERFENKCKILNTGHYMTLEFIGLTRIEQRFLKNCLNNQ